MKNDLGFDFRDGGENGGLVGSRRRRGMKLGEAWGSGWDIEDGDFTGGLSLQELGENTVANVGIATCDEDVVKINPFHGGGSELQCRHQKIEMLTFVELWS